VRIDEKQKRAERKCKGRIKDGSRRGAKVRNRQLSAGGEKEKGSVANTEARTNGGKPSPPSKKTKTSSRGDQKRGRQTGSQTELTEGTEQIIIKHCQRGVKTNTSTPRLTKWLVYEDEGVQYKKNGPRRHRASQPHQTAKKTHLGTTFNGFQNPTRPRAGGRREARNRTKESACWSRENPNREE